MKTTSGLPLDDETRDWREMPFLDDEHKHWRRPTISGDHMAVYVAEGALGIYYALNLIGHFLVHGEHYGDMGHRLVTLIDEMLAAGPLGPLEKSFIGALGDFIGTGRLSVSPWFDAVPVTEARAKFIRAATEACQ